MRYIEIIHEEIIEEGPIWDKTKKAAKAAAVVGGLGAATMGAAGAAPWVNPDAPQATQAGSDWHNPNAPRARSPRAHRQATATHRHSNRHAKQAAPHRIKPSKCMMSADGKTIDCYMSDGGKTSISAVDNNGEKLSKHDIQQRLKAEYSLYTMKRNNYNIDEPNYDVSKPAPLPKRKPTPPKTTTELPTTLGV